MTDELIGCVLTFFGITLAVAAVLSGLWWLLVHGWPFLLLGGLVLLVVFIVRAYRQSLVYRQRQVDLKVNQAKRQLDDDYQQVKAQMEQAAREWQQRR